MKKTPKLSPERVAALKKWAARQRAAYAAGRLPRDKIVALEKLKGWTWDAAQSVESTRL